MADEWAIQVIKLLRQSTLFGFPVSQMTHDDIEAEIEHLSTYLRECEKTGQGIGSRESVRMRDLLAERAKRQS